MRILVIDNDPDVLDVIGEILSYAGHEVTSLEEVDDIISVITHHEPDIVLLDYLLNGANGGEICCQIKANAGTCALPVIILSAYPRVFQLPYDYDCNLFMPKPFDIEDLLQNVDLLTGLSRENNLP